MRATGFRGHSPKGPGGACAAPVIARRPVLGIRLDVMPRKLIAGNWKMNGLRADGVALAEAVSANAGALTPEGPDLLICPPATLIEAVGRAVSGSTVALGAQDCHWEKSGAFTGDISAAMLADLGCGYVIVGHSERRQGHRENDRTVAAKAAAALEAGMVPIICVGETEAERDSGRAVSVVSEQVRSSLPDGARDAEIVIAYEPVWAIGTGRTASPRDVDEMHAVIRQVLTEAVGAERAAALRLLYGGSVKPGNAAELLSVANVDGALVGGASLVADDFLAIARAAAD